MDPVTIITGVYTLSLSLKAWLDNKSTKDTTVDQISKTVTRICDIVFPLQSEAVANKLERPLCESLCGVAEALKRTQKHLFLWENKKSSRVLAFLNPSTVTMQLQDDERHLTHQIIIVLFSMAVTSFFRDHNMIQPKSTEDFSLSFIENPEVKEFWRDYIGSKVYFINTSAFCERLKLWYKEGLSDSACKNLIMCLDEFAVGGVTPWSLEALVGKGPLKDTIRTFVIGGNFTQFYNLSPDNGRQYTPPPLPLIVWIDDNPSNNVHEVAFARNRGISVIELTSTAMAEAWIDENSGFLRENDDPSRIRFISDNARMETSPSAGTFLNMSAGEAILRYLRGRQYGVPVLIYCGQSVVYTQYVSLYHMAGSTASCWVCESYIDSLGMRRKDDDSWKGFNKF